MFEMVGVRGVVRAFVDMLETRIDERERTLGTVLGFG